MLNYLFLLLFNQTTSQEAGNLKLSLFNQPRRVLIFTVISFHEYLIIFAGGYLIAQIITFWQ